MRATQRSARKPRSRAPVVHQQQIQVPNVVHHELQEAVAQHVLRLLVRAVANVRHQRRALELAAAAGVDTLGPAPRGLHRESTTASAPLATHAPRMGTCTRLTERATAPRALPCSRLSEHVGTQSRRQPEEGPASRGGGVGGRPAGRIGLGMSARNTRRHAAAEQRATPPDRVITSAPSRSRSGQPSRPPSRAARVPTLKPEAD